MRVEDFVKVLDVEFYTGVPDSQLRPLCDYLINNYGTDSRKHIIGVNEGNCVAMAAGYHLATGKTPVIYLQNSGIGNIINPVTSLLNEEVYGIGCIFVIGWRGEPGVPDEPQHIFQGEITLELLSVVGVTAFVITKETTCEELEKQMILFKSLMKEGRQVAFIITRGAIFYNEKIIFKNNNVLLRKTVIKHIVDVSGHDYIVSTTGKTSRELFEVREERGDKHCYDFLMVGSMGHASTIAMSFALYRPQNRIWCIDGDGALLMHMGAMALIGKERPSNLVHVVINNASHESVGGQPTVAQQVDLGQIALGCGYEFVEKVNTVSALREVLHRVRNTMKLVFIEVETAICARENLGRPTNTPKENKIQLFNSLL